MASCSEVPAVMACGGPLAEDIPHSAPTIEHDDRDAVLACLQSGWLAQGAASAQFAEALQHQSGAVSVSLASSGTSALILALLALDVHAGHEVVVPTYVCASVLEAVRASGATPVLCDIGPHWVLDVRAVGRVLTQRTRAIVAVAVFGLAWSVDDLTQFGIPVIDDRCQAFGLARPSHALVPFSVCSFHATKCLTTGEGGAVLAWTNEARAPLAVVATAHRRTLTVFSDLQSSLGLSQLAAWPQRQQRRNAISDRYRRELPASRTARIIAAAEQGSVWFRMPVTMPEGADFDTLRRRYAAAGVQVRRGVDALLHRRSGLPDSQFPGAVDAFERTLSLPIWPGMTDAQVTRVVEVSHDVLV